MANQGKEHSLPPKLLGKALDVTWREPRPSKLLMFARNFLRHPRMVGGFIPSSPFLVKEVLDQIDWQEARVIVEYGPGVGTFTSKVLDRMHPEATLVALELNEEFYRFLHSSIRDPRLRLFHESATEVDSVLARLGLPHVDYAISGIPFNPLEPRLRDTIVRKTHAVLRPDGAFLVYQFTSTVRPYLEKTFTRVSRRCEWLNVFPAQLYYCAR
jgi:phospholipid N-methyltransferase